MVDNGGRMERFSTPALDPGFSHHRRRQSLPERTLYLRSLSRAETPGTCVKHSGPTKIAEQPSTTFSINHHSCCQPITLHTKYCRPIINSGPILFADQSHPSYFQPANHHPHRRASSQKADRYYRRPITPITSWTYHPSQGVWSYVIKDSSINHHRQTRILRIVNRSSIAGR